MSEFKEHINLSIMYVIVIIHIWFGYFAFIWHNHQIEIAFAISALSSIIYFCSLIATDYDNNRYTYYYFGKEADRKLKRQIIKDNRYTTLSKNECYVLYAKRILKYYIDNHEIKDISKDGMELIKHEETGEK